MTNNNSATYIKNEFETMDELNTHLTIMYERLHNCKSKAILFASYLYENYLINCDESKKDQIIVNINNQLVMFDMSANRGYPITIRERAEIYMNSMDLFRHWYITNIVNLYGTEDDYDYDDSYDFYVEHMTASEINDAFDTVCVWARKYSKELFGDLIDSYIYLPRNSEPNFYINCKDGVYNLMSGKRVKLVYPFPYTLQINGSDIVPILREKVSEFVTRANTDILELMDGDEDAFHVSDLYGDFIGVLISDGCGNLKNDSDLKAYSALTELIYNKDPAKLVDQFIEIFQSENIDEEDDYDILDD